MKKPKDIFQKNRAKSATLVKALHQRATNFASYRRNREESERLLNMHLSSKKPMLLRNVAEAVEMHDIQFLECSITNICTGADPQRVLV